jgi:hypothetical protein
VVGAAVRGGKVTVGPTDTATRDDGATAVDGAVVTLVAMAEELPGMPSGFNVVGAFSEVAEPVFVVGGIVTSTMLTLAVDGIALVLGAALVAGTVGSALSVVGTAVVGVGFVVGAGFVVGGFVTVGLLVGIGVVGVGVIGGFVGSTAPLVVGSFVTIGVVVSASLVSGGAVVSAVVFSVIVESGVIVESAAVVESAAATELSTAAAGATVVEDTCTHGSVVLGTEDGSVASTEGTTDVVGTSVDTAVAIVVSPMAVDGNSGEVLMPATVVSAVAEMEGVGVVPPSTVPAAEDGSLVGLVSEGTEVSAATALVDASTQLGMVAPEPPLVAPPQAIPRKVMASAAIAFFMYFP